jgi:hypothetical protein
MVVALAGVNAIRSVNRLLFIFKVISLNLSGGSGVSCADHIGGLGDLGGKKLAWVGLFASLVLSSCSNRLRSGDTCGCWVKFSSKVNRVI